MIPTYWTVYQADMSPSFDEETDVYGSMEAAVDAAKQEARRFRKPFAVYKLVQTHHVKPPLGMTPAGVTEVQA